MCERQSRWVVRALPTRVDVPTPASEICLGTFVGLHEVTHRHVATNTGDQYNMDSVGRWIPGHPQYKCTWDSCHSDNVHEDLVQGGVFRFRG